MKLGSCDKWLGFKHFLECDKAFAAFTSMILDNCFISQAKNDIQKSNWCELSKFLEIQTGMNEYYMIHFKENFKPFNFASFKVHEFTKKSRKREIKRV